MRDLLETSNVFTTGKKVHRDNRGCGCHGHAQQRRGDCRNAIYRGTDADSVAESLPVCAAEELEFALLETRGLVVSFILAKGDPNWLHDFEQKKQLFHDTLDRTKESVLSSGEGKILDGLEKAYRKYDEKLMEMIALHQSGNEDEATSIFVNEVSSLSQQVTAY